MNKLICTVAGCDGKHRARGMCFMHYQRWRTHGSTELPTRPEPPKRDCSVESCQAPHLARGFCKKHYQRWKQSGSTELTRTRTYCSVDGCDEPCVGRGWCASHYGRWKRHGDPEGTRQAPPPRPECAVDGCDRDVKGRSLCDLHLSRKRRGADLTAPVRGTHRVCKSPGCEGRYSARDLCRQHYYEAFVKPKAAEYNARSRQKRAEMDPVALSRTRAARYQANRERIRAQVKKRYNERYAQDPAPWRAAKSRRKMRSGQRMDADDRRISVDYRRAIADDPCFYCGNAEASHVDHYFPLVKGGTDHWYNLVRACSPCNLSKHKRCGTWFALKREGVGEPRRPLQDAQP